MLTALRRTVSIGLSLFSFAALAQEDVLTQVAQVQSEVQPYLNRCINSSPASCVEIDLNGNQVHPRTLRTLSSCDEGAKRARRLGRLESSGRSGRHYARQMYNLFVEIAVTKLAESCGSCPSQPRYWTQVFPREPPSPSSNQTVDATLAESGTGRSSCSESLQRQHYRYRLWDTCGRLAIPNEPTEIRLPQNCPVGATGEALQKPAEPGLRASKHTRCERTHGLLTPAYARCMGDEAGAKVIERNNVHSRCEKIHGLLTPAYARCMGDEAGAKVIERMQSKQ